MNYKEERKMLEAQGWVSKEVPYTNFGHKTRVAWSHPSGVYTKCSFGTAVEFQEKYNKMLGHQARELLK
tara:strand:+ start:6582 stop:6788 length:207 start_codon:yes stop_codon:yes gene_type:complete